MHDIDRTQMEYAPELPGFQGEDSFGESEGEWSAEMFDETVLSEAEETELASQLLEISSEGEFDQFLGSLIKHVGRVAGKAIRSPVGQALGGALKGVAKKALSQAGGAVGGYIGGPLGAKIGGGLANAASNALGLEAEMLGQEDREFEGAKRFVRVAADTVRKAAAASPAADPRAVAQAAVNAAAQRLAPGLAGASVAGQVRPGAQSGRWVRRGNRIVLFGV